MELFKLKPFYLLVPVFLFGHLINNDVNSKSLVEYSLVNCQTLIANRSFILMQNIPIFLYTNKLDENGIYSLLDHVPKWFYVNYAGFRL